MAKEHPMYAQTEWPEYEYHEFPMCVYPGSSDGGKTPDADPKHPGKFMQETVIVQNEAERRQVLGLDAEEPEAPRTPSPTRLVSDGGVKRLETEEDQRAALLEQADVLGVQVDKRWGLARIEDAIQAHKAAAEVV